MLRLSAVLLLQWWSTSIEPAASAFAPPPRSSTPFTPSDRPPLPSSPLVGRREMAKSDDIAGSFFNPVPEGGGDVDGETEKKQAEGGDRLAEAESESGAGPAVSEEERDTFDQSMAELMKKRSRKPLASKPSTIGGVPTSKATGFGKSLTTKIIKTTTSVTTKKSFVSIGKPLNDVNNPEYDDQGYTLYADEETGEKKRVFEALVEYPSIFTMKIVGANEGAFVPEIVQVVADSCEVTPDDVEHSERKKGKWTSVTVQAPVKSAEMLYMLYENIDRDPRVKFKF